MEYPIPTMKEMLEVATVDLMISEKDAEIKSITREKDDIIKKLEDELNKLK